jgi:hypothetical protein
MIARRSTRGTLSPLIGALLLVTAATPTPAFADEPHYFLEITCIPQLHYFSARRVRICNLPWRGPYLDLDHGATQRSRIAVERAFRMFSPQGLIRRPQRCAIPAFDRPAPRRDYRSAIDVRIGGRMPAWIEARLGGRRLGYFNLTFQEAPDDLVLLEVAADGAGLSIRQCVQGPDLGDTMNCTSQPAAR